MFGSRLLSLFSLLVLALMLRPTMIEASASAAAPEDVSRGTFQPGSPPPTAADISRARFPVLFVANQGQWAPEILFTAQAGAVRFVFMACEVVIQAPGATDEMATARLHLSADTASPAPASITPVAGERASTRVNYFHGSNPSDWRTNVPAYRSLRYPQVAPGVDLIFRDADGAIAYDLVVAPGADPTSVKLDLSGVETLALDDGGAMLMTLTPDIQLRQQAPFIYQEQAEARVAVNGGFVIHDAEAGAKRHSFGFQVAAYDSELPLVIDPTLTYSSFVGSALTDEVSALAVTDNGEVIVVGSTWLSNFPGTPTVFGAQSRKDALIYRIAPDGSTLDYVTILGGSGDDQANAVILNANDGSLYVTGQTASANFPTVNPLFPLLTGNVQDAFVAKLHANGNLLQFSTYFGGSRVDAGRALGLQADSLYVAGTTNSLDLFTYHALYPTALGGDDGFVLKLKFDNANIATLESSTYFGGTLFGATNGNDSLVALAVTPAGDLYLGGTTTSKDLPVLHPVQEALAGGTDVWVARIAMEGPELAFCTYLGGLKNDSLSTLLLDNDGHVFLAGLTDSLDFPVVNALYSTPKGYNDAFVAKLDASGRFLHFATYFGGNWDDRALAATLDQAVDATDGQRHLYVAGSTTSTLLPTVNPDQRWNAGIQDGWLAKFDPHGLQVSYASYFGGTNSDSLVALGSQPTTGSGAVFLAGNTASRVSGYFPQGINTPFQADNAGGIDTFVAHMQDLDSKKLGDGNKTPRFALDFSTTIPERDGAAVKFTLNIVDPAPVKISAFSTKVYYDIDTLEFKGLDWASPLDAAPYATDVDHSEPGVLRLTLYQDTGTPTALPGKLATLNFEVRDVGSTTTPPKPSKQSLLTLHESWAADLNGRNAYIDGTSGTGGVLIQRRCNNLIGDCDCSGQVRIWEVQSGVMEFIDADNDPICMKRNYTTMASTDLTEIINNHLDQVIETSAVDWRTTAQEREEQTESAVSLSTLASLKLTRLASQNGKVRAGLVLRTAGNKISLLTTDIRYDPKLFADVRPVIGAAAKKASKQMAFKVIKPGLVRVMIYGLNRNTLFNGTLATLQLTPKVDLSQHQTKLTHRPQASSPSARKIKIQATQLVIP